jgi:hypothetical protein
MSASAGSLAFAFSKQFVSIKMYKQHSSDAQIANPRARDDFVCIEEEKKKTSCNNSQGKVNFDISRALSPRGTYENQ